MWLLGAGVSGGSTWGEEGRELEKQLAMEMLPGYSQYTLLESVKMRAF